MSKKPIYILLQLIICVTFFLSRVHAQNRELSYHEFREEVIQNADDSIIIMENITIMFDPATDTPYLRKSPEYLATLDTIFIRGILQLKNITLSNHLKTQSMLSYFVTLDTIVPLFTKTVFLEDVMIDGINGWQAGFFGCTFAKKYEVNDLDTDLINFKYCHFLDKMDFRALVPPTGHLRVHFMSCHLHGTNNFIGQNYIVDMFNCHIEPEIPAGKGPRRIIDFAPDGTQNIYFGLHDCSVESDYPFDFLDFAVIYFNSIWIEGSKIGPYINFSYCTTDAFFVDSSSFDKGLFAEGFVFDPASSHVPWHQFAHKIVELDLGKDTIIEYRGVYDYEMENWHKYSLLKAAKANFFNAYQASKSTFYANQCYVEMKQMDTHMYRYMQQITPSLDNYFNWRMYQFLEVSSEYGTNPVRTLIYAGRIILFFAVIYFFLYHDWNIHRLSMIKRLWSLTRHFRGEKNLEDIYAEDINERTMPFEKFLAYMKESENEIPRFFTLMSKPLYGASLFFENLNIKFLKKLNLFDGKWNDEDPKTKKRAAITAGIYLFFFLVFSVILKAIDALLLSTNLLTTLGFGDIPESGLMRYIAYLEGVIGWFILTVFSTALVSQLLQ